ncbi:unnamed protein product, partial [marine sediment metagenome]
MEEVKKKKYMTQAISDEILDKLSLKNRYSFLNTNLTAILEPKEFNFLKKAQKFCVRFEKKNEITHGPEEDVYDWIPAFGAEGYLVRSHNFEVIDVNYTDFGFTMELMRNLAVGFFDPQFSIAGGAT